MECISLKHILQFWMHSYICTSFAGLHTLAGLAFAALLPFVAFAGLAAFCCLCWHSCPPIPAWNSRAISLGSPSHMEIYSTPRHFTPVSIHLKNIYFSCSHINGLNMDLNLFDINIWKFVPIPDTFWRSCTLVWFPGSGVSIFQTLPKIGKQV